MSLKHRLTLVFPSYYVRYMLERIAEELTYALEKPPEIQVENNMIIMEHEDERVLEWIREHAVWKGYGAYVVEYF